MLEVLPQRKGVSGLEGGSDDEGEGGVDGAEVDEAVKTEELAVKEEGGSVQARDAGVGSNGEAAGGNSMHLEEK